MAVGVYSFKGTADMKNHDSAIEKSTKEVKKYEDQVKSANTQTEKIGKQDFSGAYRSQKKLTDGVKGFTNAMNGATKGLTGLIGKAGIWGLAIAAGINLGKKALEGLSNASDDFSDRMEAHEVRLSAMWNEFKRSFLNWDFTNLFQNMGRLADQAQYILTLMDRQESYNIVGDVAISRLQNQISSYIDKANNARQAMKRAQTSGNKAEVETQKKQMEMYEDLARGTLTDLEKLLQRKMKDATRILTNISREFGHEALLESADIDNRHTDKAKQFINLLASRGDAREWGITQPSLLAMRAMFANTGGNPIADANEQRIYELMEIGKKLSESKWSSYNAATPEQNKNLNKFSDLLKMIGMYDFTLQDIDAFVQILSKISKARDAFESGGEGEKKSEEWKGQMDIINQAELAILGYRRQIDQLGNKNDMTIAKSEGKQYPKNSVGWLEKQIADQEELIKKATDTGLIKGYEAAKKELEKRKDTLLFGENTIEFVKSEMKRVSEELSKTSDVAAQAKLREEYNALSADLINMQNPGFATNPVWLTEMIKDLTRQMGEAMDATTRDTLQERIDGYVHVLNQILYANDEMSRVAAELKQYQEEANHTTGERYDNAVVNINRLNHEMNDLQNKKGSINWITQEINLLNNQLNATDSIEDMESLIKEITRLEIQLKSLQKFSEIKIEVKTTLDLREDMLNRFSRSVDGVTSSLHSMGNAFNDFATIKQGKKEWNELTEAQQKEIETLEQWGIVMNGLTDALDNIVTAWTTWQDGLIAAARAAETAVIQQENAALIENSALKSANAAVSTENAVAEAEETASRMTNTAVMEAEGVTAGAVASTKTAEAVASGSAGAAKMPFPYNIAAIAAVMAALGSVISMVAGLSKYADGGIVGGSSFAGDRMIARVNSGEMILNRRQQTRLFSILNSGINLNNGNAGGNVTFHISGTDLIGVLNNHERTRNRTR